jgi:RNA polymerase sigma-70 factor, ECF subfamily
MHEEQPGHVLDSEVPCRTTMDDLPESAKDETSVPTSDEQLMLAFVKGSAESFNELFLRYKQPLFGFFRRRVCDLAMAEELTQETFLAVLRASVRYEPNALFRTYLYAIGFKILRAHRRKAAFRAAFWVDRKRVEDPAGHDSTDSGVLLKEVMRKLESTDREILLLREFEQLSYSEIAKVLHLPLNTVRSRLFRARKALRELLETPAPRPCVQELAEFEDGV